MGITKEALRGYLLEEVLAYLIKGTGYNLLVDKSQDPDELENRHHGLVVKGRGAEHQADVLGQLKWIPAFTYPIRLFVEAKYRKTKTSIGPIRNAVGIIEDLNQNYSISGKSKILVKRYNYNYVLFSASGFSKDAVNMAIAHRISLVDLNSPDFKTLLDAVDKTAEKVVNVLNYSEGTICKSDYLQYDLANAFSKYSNAELISLMRKYIRKKLGTFPIELIEYDHLILSPKVNEICEETFKYLFDIVTQEYKMLFVAMSNGPFMLVMKADNPHKFLSFARQNPSHKINISWSKLDNEGRRWIIEPMGYGDNGYKLSFTLPENLSEFIFKSDNPKSNALDVKRQVFSDITIYNFNDSIDELYRLRYSYSSIRTI